LLLYQSNVAPTNTISDYIRQHSVGADVRCESLYRFEIFMQVLLNQTIKTAIFILFKSLLRDHLQ